MSKGVFIVIVIVVGGLALVWLYERITKALDQFFYEMELEREEAVLIEARREVDDFERWLDPRDTVDSWRNHV